MRCVERSWFLSTSDPWAPFWKIPHIVKRQKMWAGGGGSERHTNGGITVREDFEARVAGREDAGNGDMMYSGDLRCTMTTGESVGPSVQLEGSGAAGAQGSGDTGLSHDMRVGAVPAGTEGWLGGYGRAMA